LDVDWVKFLQPGAKFRSKPGDKKKDGAEDYCDMMIDGKWEWGKLSVYKDKQGKPTSSVIDGQMKDVTSPNDEN